MIGMIGILPSEQLKNILIIIKLHLVGIIFKLTIEREINVIQPEKNLDNSFTRSRSKRW